MNPRKSVNSSIAFAICSMVSPKVLAFDLLEGLGQAGQVIGRDADAGVLHDDPHALAQRVVAALGLDGDHAAARGELDGVGKQVQSTCLIAR